MPAGKRFRSPRSARGVTMLVVACALAMAPSQVRLQTSGGRASLVGHVLSRSTRQPVPGMEVGIRLTGDQVWKTTTTDEAGRYSFTDLVPGRYFVRLRGPDYQADQPDVLLSGGRMTTLTLLKRAILRGRVTDHVGQPIGGIEVCALSHRRRGERVTFVPADFGITNKDGTFEISQQLRPGPFAVAVIPTGCVLAESGRPNDTQRFSGFVPTYFPGSATTTEAGIVEITGDEERSGLDIPLRRGPTTRLSGRIAPLPQNLLPPVARVILEPLDDSVAITRVLNVGPDGRFTFDGVLPGEYRLVVPPTVLLRVRSAWAIQSVVVTGTPTQSVFVPTRPTASVSGQVAFDGQPTLLPGIRVFMTVNLEADRGASRVDAALFPTAFGQVGEEGRFVITGVMPGNYTFSVSGVSARGWILDGATIPAPPGAVPSARDVFRLPFAVKDGEDLFGAVLSLTRASSTLDVTVRDADDRPITDGEVVLFAADPKYWYPGSGRVLHARAGPTGVITFSDLPKGRYLAIAVKTLPRDWQTPARLESLIPGSTPVELAADETRALTIRGGLVPVQ